jgi:hypothetical protein
VPHVEKIRPVVEIGLVGQLFRKKVSIMYLCALLTTRS